MAFYEVVTIVRPDVSSQHVEQVAKKFEEVATSNGAKLIKTEQWGLRTLAYRVNKHRKGYYTMYGLEADTSSKALAELERQFRLSDDIIRHLAIKVDELDAEPSVQMQKKPTRPQNADFNAPEASAE